MHTRHGVRKVVRETAENIETEYRREQNIETENRREQRLSTAECERRSTAEKIPFEKSDNQRTSNERCGAGVETQKNVWREIGGWGPVPYNKTYAPSLSTIYDGA